jgi:hypothetical protein
MKNIILSLIWMAVAAMPTLNARQASPSQNAATQTTLKPKASQAFPQPRGQPTQATTANNNPGHRKLADNNPGKGKITDNDTRRGKTTNDNGDSYADAIRRYRHERHNHDWWKQHDIVIVLVGGGYYYQDSGYWYPAWG